MKWGWVIGVCCALAACTSAGPAELEPWQDLGGTTWTVGEADGPERWPAEVPGTIHTDLMRAGAIPDPYFGTNQDSVQWVGERNWTYERRFDASPELLQQPEVELVFEGLDTFAEVWLNGQRLGAADNMFRSWVFPVKALLRPADNHLVVRFTSALQRGRELLAQYGRTLPADNDVGTDKVSPFVRKAGIHFGWDFAPRLVTCGIWKQVGLRGSSGARIQSVRVFQTAKAGTREVTVAIDLRTKEVTGGKATVRVNGRTMAEAPIEDRTGEWTQELTFSLPDTGQWWPTGMGQQPLHNLSVQWEAGGAAIAQRDVRIGLRTVHLDRGPDEQGTAFRFVVNGTPLFAKGCNLVPPDMFLPRAGDSAWVELVRAMQEANMNMVRVWGGGVYPPDAFFTACDTAGILVWQDLMFANAMVPDDDAFLANVRKEVREQVGRIQHHASLALWCGNNEVEVAWHNWGWQQTYGMSAADSTRMWNAYQALFEEALKQWTYDLDRGHAYVPTSPISNWGNTEGLRHGDLHYWGVWHGDQPFEAFADNVGRFVSEYGFQSYPAWSTLARWATPEQLTDSAFWAGRQKSYKGDKAIRALAERYGVPADDRRTLVSASQELHAKAYRMAIEAHQKAWPRCAGTLLWQLNDVWPGASWSIVEYGGGRKPAFHAVKAAYRALPDQP